MIICIISIFIKFHILLHINYFSIKLNHLFLQEFKTSYIKVLKNKYYQKSQSLEHRHRLYNQRVFEMDQPYKGLSNIGATCYMNSLLQTLYMTPQFREAIYEWKYNERIHPKPSDSILYQLQKLFGKLDRRFPGEINTKQLVKSFQWEDEEAQMQQDIQQFNRVLFQALQKSLISKKTTEKTNNHFVRDLYEGQMVHYTHCNECQNQSQRQQSFQDLILTVKNPFQKVYNNRIELGIQRYMKPEILDKDNLYNCEACHKKVQAQRGVRFLKMPKLLNIIIRRFDFDYFTFQRVKLNDRVQFPHILNINNYMQGYQNIQNKLCEDSSEYFQNREPPKKFATPSTTTTQRKVVTKKSGTPNVAGKITTKPSANTKSFLAQMRKKKAVSQENSEDLLFVSGNSQIHKQESLNQSKQGSKKQIQTEQQKLKISMSEDQQKQDIKSIYLKQIQKKYSNELQLQLPLPPVLDIEPPSISQPFKKIVLEQGVTIESELSSKMQEKEEKDNSREEKLEQLNKANKQLINKYLKQGDLVYELYAVLIHNGSATHGHYYSYVKSYQNNRWFCFNDDRVTQINVDEIQKTYGGAGHSNAYALYYRQVSNKQNNQLATIIQMPKYIQLAVQEDIANIKKKQRQKIQNLQNVLVLKIYYQLSVKLLQINKSSSLSLCLLKAREMFQFPESVPIHNSRLRMFNPVSETKLDTFEGRQEMSLEDLKIYSYKTLLLQTKKESEVFQKYIIGKMNVRIALWEQCKDNIKSLDQAFLTLHKVSIQKGSLMREVQKVVKQKRKEILNIKQEDDNICIVKRHQNDQYSYHQIINFNEYKQKTVDQLMVMENQILYIEPDSNKLMWPQQFQNELFRITIKYVHGETGKIQPYLTDSRKTIVQLKRQICDILNLDPEDTIIRRGNKSGMELKNLNSTMKDSRFISGTQVYFEKGLPAKPGEIRVQLYLASDAADDVYNRLHEFQFVADVPINGQHKASEVKQLFASVLKKYKNISIQPNQFRIREKVSDKIGKIYRERPMKEQQLIQKRQIAIQEKNQGVDCKDFKDFLVYVKIWNPEKWTLSKKIQINVSKTTTMKDFAAMIYQQNQQVQIGEMEICRILSINKFSILDLCEMEYFQMTDVSVISQPLFVNADGLMFIIKSCLKQPRSLTKDEQLRFGGNIKPNFVTIKSRQHPTQSSKKEKGVTIKVIQNKYHEQKEFQLREQNK